MLNRNESNQRKKKKGGGAERGNSCINFQTNQQREYSAFDPIFTSNTMMISKEGKQQKEKTTTSFEMRERNAQKLRFIPKQLKSIAHYN